MLELTAGGQPVAVTKEQLGVSVDSSLRDTKVWRLKTADFLAPMTEHVLSNLDDIDAGAIDRFELTHFTTAAGYDKLPSVPAKPHSLELWRVRYPLDEIASGNCVFGEYRGYIRIDYDPASIPNTTPAGTVYSISLAPKTGGTAQTFYFTGDDLFKGKSPEPDPHALDRWQLELDPTREYCATITAFGDGDLARLPTVSEPICASVGQLSSSDAGANQGTLPDAAGGSPDSASGSVGGDTITSTPTATGVDPKSGCSCTLASTANGDRRGLGLATMVALAFTRRGFTRRRPKGPHRAAR